MDPLHRALPLSVGLWDREQSGDLLSGRLRLVEDLRHGRDNGVPREGKGTAQPSQGGTHIHPLHVATPFPQLCCSATGRTTLGNLTRRGN